MSESSAHKHCYFSTLCGLWCFNPGSRRVTDTLPSRTCDATYGETHICIYAYVYGLFYAWMQMRHAQPCSTVVRVIFFPTLVMAGIVNSIASELDASPSVRLVRSPVRQMQLKARTEPLKGSCVLRQERRCIRQINTLGSERVAHKERHDNKTFFLLLSLDVRKRTRAPKDCRCKFIVRLIADDPPVKVCDKVSCFYIFVQRILL